MIAKIMPTTTIKPAPPTTITGEPIEKKKEFKIFKGVLKETPDGDKKKLDKQA